MMGCFTFGFETVTMVTARPQALLIESVRYRAGFTATTSRVVQAPQEAQSSPYSRELNQFSLSKNNQDLLSGGT
jgi:hypothetical protein